MRSNLAIPYVHRSAFQVIVFLNRQTTTQTHAHPDTQESSIAAVMNRIYKQMTLKVKNMPGQTKTSYNSIENSVGHEIIAKIGDNMLDLDNK